MSLLFSIIAAHALWPRPSKSEFGSRSSKLEFSKIEFRPPNEAPSFLVEAFERFSKFYNFESDREQETTTFTCTYTTVDEEFQLETKESYQLSTDSSGIMIEAESVFGCIRGLSTLHQLIEPSEKEGYEIINIPIHIEDEPRFPHRGVLIDTSRHFIPVSTITQILQGMFLSKLNVLHWHIVDATSFAFRSKSRPRLADMGAYSSEEIYSTSDISHIVSEARSRGIRVMIEVDTPGHVWSWGQAYPDIVKCNGVEDQHSDMCPGPPCGFLDLSHEDTFPIVSDVINELIDLVPGALFHLGGDEVGHGCYETYDTTQDWFEKLQGLLKNKNRKPAFWHDGIEEMGITVNKDEAVLINWANLEVGQELVSKGYQIVQMVNSHLFLDCGIGNYISGAESWCDPYKTWQMIYAFDPLEGIPSQKQSQVLGAQAAMWTEMTSKETIVSRIFPRASAMSEVLWSGADINYFSNPTPDAMGRFLKFREFLTRFNLSVSAPTSKFCLLHPEHCQSYLHNVYENRSQTDNSNSYDVDQKDEL